MHTFCSIALLIYFLFTMDAIDIYARYIQIFAQMKQYLKLVNDILQTFILYSHKNLE